MAMIPNTDRIIESVSLIVLIHKMSLLRLGIAKAGTMIKKHSFFLPYF